MVEKIPYSNCQGVVPNVDWIKQYPIPGKIMYGVSIAVLLAVGTAVGVGIEFKKFGGKLKTIADDVRASLREWDNERLAK